MKIGAVIPAAGEGRRMKIDKYKQFINLFNYPLIVHTLKLFQYMDEFSEIITVVPADTLNYCKREICKKYKLENIKLVAGAGSRQESVFLGLKAFSKKINYVIIHDGVRPLLPKKVLQKLLSSLKHHEAVTTGVQVKNTIKVKDNNNFVVKTLDRDSLSAIQTPQGFNYQLILNAHKSVSTKDKYFDDASLVENFGYPVKIIEGSYKNIKITTPEDLLLAEYILKSEKEKSNESRAWI